MKRERKQSFKSRMMQDSERQRMCVPEYGELKKDIMKEAYSSASVMHPGSTKMYSTLKEHY